MEKIEKLQEEISKTKEKIEAIKQEMNQAEAVFFEQKKLGGEQMLDNPQNAGKIADRVDHYKHLWEIQREALEAGNNRLQKQQAELHTAKVEAAKVEIERLDEEGYNKALEAVQLIKDASVAASEGLAAISRARALSQDYQLHGPKRSGAFVNFLPTIIQTGGQVKHAMSAAAGMMEKNAPLRVLIAELYGE